MDIPSLFAFFDGVKVLPPAGAMPTVEIVLRWIHFVAGIAWIGLLYFFNLVNVPFMKQVDAAAKPKVFQHLTLPALWYFRWGAVLTVLAGFLYWMVLVMREARAAVDGPASPAMAIVSFLLIWTVAWAVEAALVLNNKGALNNGSVLAGAVFVIVVAASWTFLTMNSNGWEGHRTLSIGIGGGLGWMMMLNVWGIIWRHNKKVITGTLAGSPPSNAADLGRQAFLASRTNAWLSLPMLFFMAASSHYTFLVQ
jgi:uncharacterized membrane protein